MVSVRDRLATTLLLALLLIACESVVRPESVRVPVLSDCGVSAADSFPVPLIDGDGLYGNGSNEPPPAHQQAGLEAADAVPAAGALLVSLGMSGPAQVWDSWADIANTDAILPVPSGACGSCTTDEWDEPTDQAWIRAIDVLEDEGYTGADVDVVWVNVMNRARAPTPPSVADLEAILVQIEAHYPNVKQVFVNSYVYLGYWKDGAAEPESWQTGVNVCAFVLNHFGETDPWVGWGPYLWSNGADPNGEGLAWLLTDFKDGLHLNTAGQVKAAERMEEFFQTSPLTDWYR